LTEHFIEPGATAHSAWFARKDACVREHFFADQGGGCIARTDIFRNCLDDGALDIASKVVVSQTALLRSLVDHL
jgi:hypothetical protein